MLLKKGHLREALRKKGKLKEVLRKNVPEYIKGSAK